MMYEYIYRPVEDSKLLNILRRESMESFAEQKFRVFTEMRLNKLKHQFLKNIRSNNAYFRTKLLWEINDEYEMNMSVFTATCITLSSTFWPIRTYMRTRGVRRLEQMALPSAV